MTGQRKTHPVMKVIGIGLLCLGAYAFLHPTPSSTHPESSQPGSMISDGTSGSVPAISANQPLELAALAARLKTIKGVLDAKPPGDDDNQKFLVHVSADSAWDGGDKVKDVLHTIHNHIGNRTYNGARVFFTYALVNQYGEKSNDDVFALDYTPEDIHRMVFENITTFDVLNMGQYLPMLPAAQHIVGESCSNDTGMAKYAGTFCGNVLTTAP